MRATRPFISSIPSFMAFLACLLLSANAWSQSDRGQWQILQARYGTAERNIDVTQTLRELARQDSSFRITNRTFGNDPDPGVVKTLRIYARGQGGATRVFEYRENDIIDGTAFTGWRSGGWGHGAWNGGWGDPGNDQQVDRGQWQILQARYGTAQGSADVTQTLRNLARKDISFHVTNRTFGNDPDPGVVKTLRIYARGPGGATRTFEYGENQIVNGAMFTGWRSGNWGRGGGWNSGWGHDTASDVPQGGVTIVSAQYGEGPSRRDVTSRLRSMVRDGRISMPVNNDTMGTDPAPGRPKTLWLTYYAGGQGQRNVAVRENEQLMLP